MNRATIRARVLRRINQLASDESTAIEGRVTTNSINEAIDDIYRGELCSIFIDKYPDLFKATLTPFNTNTASATVDATSSGNTLVVTEDTFVLNDVGTSVYNPATSQIAEITAYASATEVTLSLEINDDWDGDTIYVLGNEYLLSEATSTQDIREVMTVRIKYASDDSKWTIAERMDETDAKANGGFDRYHPKFYLTSLEDEHVTQQSAIGILPFPNKWDGLIQIQATIIPPELTDTTNTKPIPGIDLAIYNGAVAICLRDLDMFDKADVYQGLYNSEQARILRSFKPKSRSGPSRIRMSSTTNLMRSRKV